MVYGLSPVPPRPKQQVYVDPEVPAYKVIEKRGFFDEMDQLWEKGSLIYWEGPLNPGLEPINDIAKAKFRAYLVDLDKKGQEVAEKRGAGHASLVNAYDAKRILQEMDRKERGIGVDKKERIMGGDKSQARKAVRIGDANVDVVPMMQAKKDRTPENEMRANTYI